MTERRFPVLFSSYREQREMGALGCPDSVPWAAVAPHEHQARRNHYQSLEQLADRGGLCPRELVAVVADVAFEEVRHMLKPTVVAFLQRIDREPEWAAKQGDK